MYNEMEVKQGLQGKVEEKAEPGADDKLRSSASDQVITFLDGTKYVRRLGESVPVPFAGETISLRPGSYYFLGMLKEKIREATNKMSAIAVASKAVLNELELYNQAKKTDTEQDEILGRLAEKIGAIYKGMDDVRTLTRDAKLSAVQFIIYDIKVPNWPEAVAEGFPQEAALEAQYPIKKMLRDARREEIDNLLHVYKQIHEAVLPAESFFGLQGVI